MENGRCAKNCGTGKCHSCFPTEEEGRFKKLYRGHLGRSWEKSEMFIKGIVHDKPERETAITRRQQNFTQNWPYLPKLIFSFDYTETWTSAMHFMRSLMILYIMEGGWV